MQAEAGALSCQETVGVKDGEDKPSHVLIPLTKLHNFLSKKTTKATEDLLQVSLKEQRQEHQVPNLGCDFILLPESTYSLVDYVFLSSASLFFPLNKA